MNFNWLKDKDNISVILSIIAITFSFWSYRNTVTFESKTEKARFLSDYTLQFIETGLDKIIVELEYDDFEFKKLRVNNIKNKAQNDEEKRLSDFLNFLNIIAYNCDQGIISIHELKNSTLGYAIFVAYNSKEIQDYMNKIDERSFINKKIPRKTAWGYLRKIGKQMTKLMRTDKYLQN